MLESALLIEEIVLDQMVSLLLQAAQIATSRGSQYVGLEDILFLMRKDKVKLVRLFRYLSIKDMKATLLRGTGIEDESVEDCGSNCEASIQPLEAKPQQTKRVKLCYDFLSSIDQTGELLSVFDDDFFDEIKYRRNLRVERMTVNMTESQYLKYFEARQASFANKARPTKFRDWLMRDNLVQLKPDAFAIEVLQYLAYETVAEIVDLALLVKQDAERQKLDPVSCFISSKMQNPDYPLFHLDPDVVTLTTPSSNAHEETLQTTADKSQVSPKAKRRKTDDGHCSPEITQPHRIRPEDIKEALRRYWTPSGPSSLFEKSECKSKLICI
ncbi:transcription initiation protein SPT3-like protein [Dinothrombium tinctorium]|uniref:Transcription initiation protein SPT3-like protein n=1 Tax=Dinothrombium tinctorium TaxID=1965070 RepID=A0A443RI91_9ACAR|nr:transcription initiation protein SPT3-like protein [Dinothrombium tinctorium]